MELLSQLTILRSQVPESALQLDSPQDIERAVRLVSSKPEYIQFINISIDKHTPCHHDDIEALFKAIASEFTGRLDLTLNNSIHTRNDCSSLISLLNNRR